MAEAQSARGRSLDRSKVAAGQDHEVAYEAGKTGKSRKAVRQAVNSAGNGRAAVERELGSK